MWNLFSTHKTDIYDEMHKDHTTLVDNLRTFRSNPSSMVEHLRSRIKKYRTIKGQTFLFSDKFDQKAVRIYEEGRAEKRISELADQLEHQTNPIGQTIQLCKLYECASKICQSIAKNNPQKINFKPQTSELIRKLVDSDDKVKLPNQIHCLVAVSFNENYESLMALIIDDDLMERPNRRVLMDPNNKYVGICSVVPKGQKHLKYTVYLLTSKALRPKDKSNQISIGGTSKQTLYAPTYKQQKRLTSQGKSQYSDPEVRILANHQNSSRISINDKNSHDHIDQSNRSIRSNGSNKLRPNINSGSNRISLGQDLAYAPTYKQQQRFRSGKSEHSGSSIKGMGRESILIRQRERDQIDQSNFSNDSNKLRPLDNSNHISVGGGKSKDIIFAPTYKQQQRLIHSGKSQYIDPELKRVGTSQSRESVQIRQRQRDHIDESNNFNDSKRLPSVNNSNRISVGGDKSRDILFAPTYKQQQRLTHSGKSEFLDPELKKVGTNQSRESVQIRQRQRDHIDESNRSNDSNKFNNSNRISVGGGKSRDILFAPTYKQQQRLSHFGKSQYSDPDMKRVGSSQGGRENVQIRERQYDVNQSRASSKSKKLRIWDRLLSSSHKDQNSHLNQSNNTSRKSGIWDKFRNRSQPHDKNSEPNSNNNRLNQSNASREPKQSFISKISHSPEAHDEKKDRISEHQEENNLPMHQTSIPQQKQESEPLQRSSIPTTSRKSRIFNRLTSHFKSKDKSQVNNQPRQKISIMQ